MVGTWREKAHEICNLWSINIAWTLWGKRVLVLPNELTAASGAEVIVQLEMLLAQNSKPILLICDGSGGEPMASIQLAAYIRTCPALVVTMVWQEASSAAVLVFAAGHYRVMHVKARLGFHGYRLRVYGKPDEYGPDVEARMGDELSSELIEHLHRQNELFHDYLANLAGQRIPEELFGRDIVFLRRRQSYRLGLVDEAFLKPPVEVWVKTQMRARKHMARAYENAEA